MFHARLLFFFLGLSPTVLQQPKSVILRLSKGYSRWKMKNIFLFLFKTVYKSLQDCLLPFSPRNFFQYQKYRFCSMLLSNWSVPSHGLKEQRQWKWELLHSDFLLDFMPAQLKIYKITESKFMHCWPPC